MCWWIHTEDTSELLPVPESWPDPPSDRTGFARIQPPREGPVAAEAAAEAAHEDCYFHLLGVDFVAAKPKERKKERNC